MLASDDLDRAREACLCPGAIADGADCCWVCLLIEEHKRLSAERDMYRRAWRTVAPVCTQCEAGEGCAECGFTGLNQKIQIDGRLPGEWLGKAWNRWHGFEVMVNA